MAAREASPAFGRASTLAKGDPIKPYDNTASDSEEFKNPEKIIKPLIA
jgi:hypothetical protein